MTKIAIVTGITGQDGAYLSQLLLKKNYRVIGLCRNASKEKLAKLEKLNLVNLLEIIECDLMDFEFLKKIILDIQPDEIYNLAAQSSVSLSFKKPIDTISFNTISVINILEIIRHFSPKIKFYQATSSEMYGDVTQLPITENTILNPQSPYAISKASAHMLVRLYRESYNLFVCNGILFNHESVLRDDSFFIKKVIDSAIRIKNNKQENLSLGNIEIKRDFGYSPLYVEAMCLMLQKETPNDYLICSGKSIYLKDIVYFVFNYLGISKDKLIIDKSLFRPSEIKDIYGSNNKAKDELNWHYNLDFYEVLKEIIDEQTN